MNVAQRAFLDALAALPSVDEDPDLWRKVYDLTVPLEHHDNSSIFPALFRFFEQHPHAEHGTPGPLVHLIERALPSGYEQHLLDSIRRKPVPHTLWMANRLLNSPAVAGQLRDSLTSALQTTLGHPEADEVTRQEARQFLRHQGLPEAGRQS
jgi:hypothetical protein